MPSRGAGSASPCSSAATSSTVTARSSDPARARRSLGRGAWPAGAPRSPPPRPSSDGVAWTFAPMVDISEEPRWGRVAESLGETPVLSGRLAAAMVRGFQGADPADPDRSRPVPSTSPATASSAGGRDYDTVSVGENTLRNLHLRPFQAAVDAGVAPSWRPSTTSTASPMHAHRHLLRDVLKGEWGFDGRRRRRLERHRPARQPGRGRGPARRRPPGHRGGRRPRHVLGRLRRAPRRPGRVRRGRPRRWSTTRSAGCCG